MKKTLVFLLTTALSTLHFFIVELKLYADLLVDDDIKVDPIPAPLNGVTHWQYGTEQHASAS